MPVADWDRVLAVNLRGTFLCTRALLGQMLDRGSGRIINSASQLGQIGGAEVAHYAASKAGVIGADQVAGAGGRPPRLAGQRDRARPDPYPAAGRRDRAVAGRQVGRAPVAVLSQTLTFLEPLDVRDWHRVRVVVPYVGAGRLLARGKVFDAQGRLAVTSRPPDCSELPRAGRSR